MPEDFSGLLPVARTVDVTGLGAWLSFAGSWCRVKAERDYVSRQVSGERTVMAARRRSWKSFTV